MILPVIFGIAGTELRPDERALFAEANPLGFILFARNLESPAQTGALVRGLRETAGRHVPVLIDQEGGRVQRLGPPHVPAYPPASVFGQLAARDLAEASAVARTGYALIGRDLATLGIDVNCAPVLDLLVDGADAVIGDRAFADDPSVVARLGRAAAEGLGLAGVLPIVKHIPGHGRAETDSHAELPVVETNAEALDTTDFEPFRALRDAPIAMTAHVVYTAYDPGAPLTVSRRAIQEVVRERIGFEGLLLSDDLGMKALAGSAADNAVRALAAGCDVVLHCNGILSEMAALARRVPPLSEAAMERWEASLAWLAARRDPRETSALDFDAFRKAVARV